MTQCSAVKDATVVVVTNLARGGAQQVALTFARHLSGTGRLIQLMLLDPTRRSLASTGVRSVNGVLGSVGSNFLYPICIVVMAVRLRKLKPKVILSTLLMANVAALISARLALGGAPLCIIRETTTVGARLVKSGLSGRIRLALARTIYPLADLVIAPSEGVAKDLIGIVGVSKQKIQILHNPTLDSEFDGKLQEPANHPFFAEGSTPVFTACGRLGPEKGYDTLLRAFGKVSEKYPQAKLIVMGEGPLRSELQDMASAIGVADKIDFAGYVDNPLPTINRSDVFVLPSRWEGLPNALIQALGCGTTPVATDCPSGPREILENGRYGFLVPVDDVDALASDMIRAWQSPKRRELLMLRAQDFSEEHIMGVYDAMVEAALRARA